MYYETVAKVNRAVDNLIDSLLDSGEFLSEMELAVQLGFDSEIELFAFQSAVKHGCAGQFVLDLEIAQKIDSYILANTTLTHVDELIQNLTHANGWNPSCHHQTSAAMAG
jgi:hypothetical protein